MIRVQNILFVLSLLCPSIEVSSAQEREATPAVVNPALTSSLRETISLDGLWDFTTDSKNEGEEQKWFRPEKSLPNKVSIMVPACWEAQGIGGPGNSTTFNIPERNLRPLRGTYVGAAWYKKIVEIPKDWTDKQVWLKVGGVNARGQFWVNGTYVAHVANYCGTYKYNITDLVRPDEIVVIAAKVRNDLPGRKGLSTWIQNFGGLYRSVEIEATSEVWIDNAYVEPLFDEKKAIVHIKLRSVTLAGPSNYEIQIIGSTIEGARAGSAVISASLSAKERVDLVVDLALDPFRPWSPEHRNLYKAEIILKKNDRDIDGWVERFGVRKWEVRGEDFYLNNQRYLLRGYGDDSIYPITLCSPASREEHKKQLQLAKDYGFNYVRLHTHCEVPEYFEAADEIGIMIQPELPYFQALSIANLDDYFRPKEDLVELITHYRRYVSLSTYCAGNEGHLGSLLEQELYQLAKQLDATRLFLHQSGGSNTPENSDFNTTECCPEMYAPHWVENRLSRPCIMHEYMNLATDEDPRLVEKYTGAMRPPVPVAAFKKKLEVVGLNWAWGIACLDAGNELQRIYQKRGLEAARLVPRLDGYNYWGIVDVGMPSAEGLFNQFWKPKASTAEYFSGFNNPTVLLAKFSPEEQILTDGDELRIEWWISHFDWGPVKNNTLIWKLVEGNRTIKSGRIEGISVEAGEVKAIGITKITVPSLSRAVKTKLIVELERTNIENSWDLWLFPKMNPRAGAGRDICASEEIYSVLADRYPGMSKLGSPRALNAKIYLADSLDDDVLNALDQDKSVILFKLIGPNPGVKLGWWDKNDQTGAAVAKHPVFGSFPHDGYLNELFFRMVKNTFRLEDGRFNSVEPLMVGHGIQGYLLYAFQAKAGKGKILGLGLDLLSENPESVFLLNEIITYVQSKGFQPERVLDIKVAKATVENKLTFIKSLNGWYSTIESPGDTLFPSFQGMMKMYVARASDGQQIIRWKTHPVSKDAHKNELYTFGWVAGAGGVYKTPEAKFTLFLGDKELLNFDASMESATWKNRDGKINLEYEVKEIHLTYHWHPDGHPVQTCSGIMKLTLPSALLIPGKSAELKITPSKSNGARWVSLYENPRYY